MKLDFFIEKLVEIKKEYGGDLKLVYAIDDEGNSFDYVFYNPSIGHLDEDMNFDSSSDNPTVVCVN